MGRAGRVTASGERSRTLMYVLYNAQDIGRNVLGMSDVVRQVCQSTETCLREVLKRCFVGDYAEAAKPTPGFCCSTCDRTG